MPSSIDHVIHELDRIVRASAERRSPLGYFAALYKRVTIAVAVGIEQNQFEDGPRMEKLDIIFASRYLDAYRSFQAGEGASQSWVAAFSPQAPRLTTLQYLLLGMNAHISLDLGIAAAAAADGRPLSLKKDFHFINSILGSLIDDTQRRLTRIVPSLGIVDRLVGPVDEQLSIYSIAYARDKAWTQALELSLAPPRQQTQLIADRDRSVARFSQCLSRPRSLPVRLLLLAIRFFERGDVRSRIELLEHLPVAEPQSDESAKPSQNMRTRR